MHTNRWLLNIPDRKIFEDTLEDGDKVFVGQLTPVLPRRGATFHRESLSAFAEMYRRRIPMFIPLLLSFIAFLVGKAEYVKTLDFSTRCLMGASVSVSMLYGILLFILIQGIESTIIRSIHVSYAPNEILRAQESMKFYEAMNFIFIGIIIELFLWIATGLLFIVSVVRYLYIACY